MLGIVIYVTTNKGTVKIELSDTTAKVEVKIDGEQIKIVGLKDPLSLSVGEHALEVASGEFQTFTQSFVIHRGEEELVRVELQKPDPKKAEHHGVPDKIPNPPPAAAPVVPLPIAPANGWPVNKLRPEKIPAYELKMASAGLSEPPRGLVGILGDSRLKFWADAEIFSKVPQGVESLAVTAPTVVLSRPATILGR